MSHRKPHLRGRGPTYPILDQIVQYPFEPGYVVFTMPCAKRIRVQACGQIVADTTRALILFESDHIPIYYFPLADIRMDLMENSTYTCDSPFKGTARHYSLRGAGEAGEAILWHYDRPIPECPDISGHASFYWHEVEKWFEEDEEVFVHVRDPFRRVDCLASSRRVTVELGGQVVAETTRAVFVFETGLPVRYYMPAADIRAAMSPSSLVTRCPYKGAAGYHHVTVGDMRHDNLVWHYDEPVHEVAPIKGLHAFVHERVDRLLLDGVAVERPATALTHG
ncbi:MAG: DUF427 domain-containing protein, partial [Gemmobacter sp.]